MIASAQHAYRIWRLFDDPLHGDGYQFWSGIGSGSPIIAGVLLMLKKHNCHVTGCKSVLTSTDPAVHAPACRRHHSHGHLQGKEIL